jgi:hypothetical protein
MVSGSSTAAPLHDGGRRGVPSRRSIFLSYRRQETSHLAGRLADRLFAQFGEAYVFMDVDSIAPGSDFGEAIARAVNECAVLLALIGPSWISAVDARGRRRLDDPDDLVVLELQAALDRAIPVIPVLVDGAKAPTRDELPPTLGALARRQALRIDHDTFRTDCAALLDHVARFVAEAKTEVTDLAARSDDNSAIAPKRGSDLGEEDREAVQQHARREQQAPEAAQEQDRREQARREQQAREAAQRHQPWRERQAWDARPPQAMPAWQCPEPSAPLWRRGRRTPLVLSVLAMVAVGSIIAAAMLNLGPKAGIEQPPATTDPATTAAPAATPKATPSVEDDFVLVQEPVSVLQNYYGLLPDDTDSAWQLLGPEAQSQSGGQSGYARFWAEMAAVSLQNVRQTSDDTVEGTVVYTRRDGGTSSEPYRFVLYTGSDGQTIIQSFSRL